MQKKTSSKKLIFLVSYIFSFSIYCADKRAIRAFVETEVHAYDFARQNNAPFTPEHSFIKKTMDELFHPRRSQALEQRRQQLVGITFNGVADRKAAEKRVILINKLTAIIVKLDREKYSPLFKK